MRRTAQVEKVVAMFDGDPAKLRNIADTLERQSVHRGLFVRIQAALLARDIRAAAAHNAHLGETER